MNQELKSSFSNRDILNADGIVRHRITPHTFECMARRAMSGVSTRRHAPSFAEFIQR